METEEHLCRLNLLPPMSDQERISPYNINTSDEGKVICQSWDCWLIQYQIQQTNHRSDEGLTLETSAFLLFTVANLRFQPSC